MEPKNNLAKKLISDAQKRFGLRAKRTDSASRFRHRQVDVWTRAFDQAERNGRISIILGVLLALSLALNIVQQGAPVPVIFVDQLGNAKYFPALASPAPASDREANMFAGRWVEDFLSRDTTEGRVRVARALSVTEPVLREKLKKQLIDSGELDRAMAANLRTSIIVKTKETKRVADDRLEVVVTGSRVFSAAGAERQTLAEPFTITLFLSATDRTDVVENGLLVRYVAGTFGDHHELGVDAGSSN